MMCNHQDGLQRHYNLFCKTWRDMCGVWCRRERKYVACRVPQTLESVYLDGFFVLTEWIWFVLESADWTLLVG